MKHSQTGWIMIIAALIVAIMAYTYNHDRATTLIILGIAVMLLLLFYNLTIEVSDEYVKFSFGIGLIHGKYKITDIVSCQPINYFPLGWGIRFRPGAILYNVSGNKAIELSVRGKSRKIWIGTDRPEEIAKYINTKIQK